MTQTVLLGDFVDISSSKRIFYKEYVTSGVPFYRSKEIIEKASGNKDISTELFISEERFNEIASKFGAPTEGDLLLTSVGTLGVPYLVQKDEKFYFKDGNLTWFRNFSSELDGRFLLYWLTSKEGKRELLNHTIGSTQKALTIQGLKKVKIPLPDLETQKKIAEVLGRIDEKIELNRAMNETLEQMGQALFRHYFIDNPEAETWDSGTLSDIINLNPRESVKKGASTTHLEMKNMPESGMSIKGTEARAFTSGMKFRNGDTLLARITPCLENGKTAYVDFLDNTEVGFGSTEYIVMRAKNENVREYTYFLARSDKFRAHAIKSMVGTSGRQRVQNVSIASYEVQIPDVELLAKFHEKMQDTFAQIRSNAQQIQTLTTLRDTLLPRLISGKVKV